MKNINYIAGILLIFQMNYSIGQALTNHWNVTTGSTDGDEIIKLAVDKNQNSLTFGVFRNTIDLDPSGATLNKTPKGRGDCYIQKLDVNGNLKWAVSFGGKFEENPFSISTDKNGAIYATGYFQDTADFDPGAGTFNLVTKNVATFILKLDSNGIFKWAKMISGGYAEVKRSAITIDNNLLIVGTYIETVDFNPDAGVTNLKALTDVKNAFLSKYDANTGALIWAKDFVTTQTYVELNDVAIDKQGNILTCGYYGFTTDFNPGSGTFNMSPLPNFQEAFVSKLAPDGSFVWAKQFDGSSVQAYVLSTDMDDNVCIGGTFYANVDFDPGTAEDMQSSSQSDLFLVKLNKNGQFVWSQPIRVSSFSTSFFKSLNYDALGNIMVSGNFTDSVDFDPGTAKRKLGSGKFISSIFIAKYNSQGEYIYAKKLGNDVEVAISMGAVLSNTGAIYHCGLFSGSVNFGINSSPSQKTSAGDVDEFVQRFNCPIGAKIIFTGTELKVSLNAEKYQWYNCATDLPIAGETSQSYIPPANGNYSCALSKGECTEIIPCYNLTNLSVPDHLNSRVKIFPNPCSNFVNIELSSNFSNAEVTIFGIEGNSVLEYKNITENTFPINIETLPSGIYFLKINADNTFYSQKLIVLK